MLHWLCLVSVGALSAASAEMVYGQPCGGLLEAPWVGLLLLQQAFMGCDKQCLSQSHIVTSCHILDLFPQKKIKINLCDCLGPFTPREHLEYLRKYFGILRKYFKNRKLRKISCLSCLSWLSEAKYWTLWHRRLRHAHQCVIKHLRKKTEGGPHQTTNAPTGACEGCEKGKSKRLPFPT